MASSTSALSEAIILHTCTDFLADDNERRHMSAECGQVPAFLAASRKLGVLDAATKTPSVAVPYLTIDCSILICKLL